MAVVHKLKLLATSLAVGIVGYSGWRVISAQVKIIRAWVVVMVMVHFRTEKVKDLRFLLRQRSRKGKRLTEN